jgi:hypothetical protein
VSNAHKNQAIGGKKRGEDEDDQVKPSEAGDGREVVRETGQHSSTSLRNKEGIKSFLFIIGFF